MELHRKLLSIVRGDETCRRLMTIPGVGPVTSLAFTSTIDVPARFSNSRAVGPALGLTPCSINRGKAAPFKRNDELLKALPIGVVVFPSSGTSPQRHEIMHRSRQKPALVNIPRAKRLGHVSVNHELTSPSIPLLGQAPRCLVPGSHDVILSREAEEMLW